MWSIYRTEEAGIQFDRLCSQEATNLINALDVWLVGCQDADEVIQRPVWPDEGRESESLHIAEWTLHRGQDGHEHKLHRGGPQTPQHR